MSDVMHNAPAPTSKRHRLGLFACCMAPAMLAAGWWAFEPLPRTADGDVSASIEGEYPAQPTSQPSVESTERIDTDVFSVVLWTPPAAQETVPDATHAKSIEKPPLRVQLIGIITEPTGRRMAALYDIDDDRLVIVGDGELIHDRRIHIPATGRLVQVGDGSGMQQLFLRPPQDTPG